MSQKKIKKPEPKPVPVNQYDQLFGTKQTFEGITHVDKNAAALIADLRKEDDERVAKENGEKVDKNTKYKAVRTIPLEVIRTIFLDESTWNLRTATVARMKSDPRVIFVLSSLEGWKFAGLRNDPKTSGVVVAENVTYVLPSLIAETVTGGGNAVLAKLPLDKRVGPYMSALAGDVDKVIRSAVKQAERDRRDAEENGTTPADELSKRRNKRGRK